MPVDFFARILPVPFLPAEIAGSARQACNILNQAGCDVNEDKACGQKIQLAYCSNALRSVPLRNPSRSSASPCRMPSRLRSTEIWDILATRPPLLFRFFAFVLLCFPVPGVQVQILTRRHRWHRRRATARWIHKALSFCDLASGAVELLRNNTYR